MELFDKKVSLAWWERLLADEKQMNKWLQKLQVTEADGYVGNFDTNARFNKTGIRKVENFLIQTARDELKHSNLLREVLAGRGVEPLLDQNPTSFYWETMEMRAQSLEEMLAVFYLGEKLASERFKIIYEHPKTPLDIYCFVEIALPDEQMHARGYETLAGQEAINKMYEVHKETVEIMMKNTKNV